MKDAAVEEIAVKCYGAIREGIEEQGPVMHESKARVGFLSLPAEMRNRIYELVLIKPGDGSHSHGEGDLHVSNCSFCNEWNRQPSLTRTCRTIRSETLPIYYACNKFRYFGAEAAFSAIISQVVSGSSMAGVSWKVRYCKLLGEAEDWLRAMGRENAALIRDFEIKVEDFEYSMGWDVGRTPPPAPHNKLAPHVAKISAALLDYLRREDIVLPACTRVLAYEGESGLQGFWMKERVWKQLTLPLLVHTTGGEGWDMVV